MNFFKSKAKKNADNLARLNSLIKFELNSINMHQRNAAISNRNAAHAHRMGNFQAEKRHRHKVYEYGRYIQNRQASIKRFRNQRRNLEARMMKQ
jgi:hypothetical protein